MTITFSEYAASSRLHLIPIRWISVLPPPAGRMNSVRAAKLEFARALLTKKQVTKGGGLPGCYPRRSAIFYRNTAEETVCGGSLKVT